MLDLTPAPDLVADGPAADLLAGLNPPQRQAVLHVGSPLLVVAGAGSGKTRVLTRRIAYLVAARAVHPGAILAITFTNKAAAEMRERVEELVGRRARLMWVATFHSACVRILRSDISRLGFSSSFSIYDDTDSKRLLTQVLSNLNLDPKRFAPKTIRNWISQQKNQLIDFEQAQTAAADHPQEKYYAAAYADYQRRLAQANALDFDDLLMTTVHLLQSFPDLREHYRRRFRHVLVDEYQDTNHAQYRLIQELCSPQVDHQPEVTIEPPELMVVGDSDQSIYRFRGATIRNILDFADDFPGATTITLEQNYRSTGNVLTAANAVINHNANRPAKRLWTDAGDGPLLTAYVADTEQDEAQFIADEVQHLVAEQLTSFRDCAVFYRTNAQSRALEEVFLRAGLPYKIVGGVRFYERREIRDVIAYLRAVANPADDVSLRRIINVPRRGIGDTTLALLDRWATDHQLTLTQTLDQLSAIPGLSTRAVRPLTEFAQLMADHRDQVAAGQPADQIMASLLSASGYVSVLEQSDDPQDQSRLENIAELVAVASEFVANAHVVDLPDETLTDLTDPTDSGPGTEAVPTVNAGGTTSDLPADVTLLGAAEPDDSLSAFLERIALVADSDQIPDANGQVDQVTLMTLHTAKGLEFETVFLTGFEDGVFPHERALADRDELAEERRLAYVGITRARHRLYLTRTVSRTLWGTPSYNPPSRFLDEIPSHLLDWRRLQPLDTWSVKTSRQANQTSDQRGAGAGRKHSPTSPVPAGFGTTSRLLRQTQRADRGRALDLVAGDRVLHPKFGLGKVISVDRQGDSSNATIDFGSHGSKLLALAYAPLEKL
ncbi:MAG: UvrD-helicase domain-containing protein [Propionibacteriaceae bacterium]|jgi:DNA helicase-2/ATP-dependent DNA helicase PcrA|nr:UvrD-helicase domain-containing protein [Propionibacteriaceae bacterium]